MLHAGSKKRKADKYIHRSKLKYGDAHIDLCHCISCASMKSTSDITGAVVL